MRGVLASILAVVCVGVIAVGSVSALYEEQAGQIDWYKEQIGVVRFAAYPNAEAATAGSTSVPPSRVKGTVVVGTESGVIALIKVKTGAVGMCDRSDVMMPPLCRLRCAVL